MERLIHTFASSLKVLFHSVNPVFPHSLSLAISWVSNVALRSHRECQWGWFT